MEPVALLKSLGFSEYEARAYVALLQRSPVTGYELAKQSGVPRADIYSVLQKLEDRGSVIRSEADSGTRFAPADPDEVIGKLERSYQEAAEMARNSMERVTPAEDMDQAWNVQGRPALLEQARAQIEKAERHMLLALGPAEAADLRTALQRAEERGVELVVLCHRACPVPCGNCRGDVHRHRVAPDDIGDWLMVVRDREEMVAGLIGPAARAAGIRSRQPLLVEMAGWHVRNGIALAALIDDVGPGLGNMLRPETRRALESVGSSEEQGWLEQLMALATSENR